MDLTRLIFRRYHEYDAGREPVISLSEFQRERIQKVLERIENGYYILEKSPCVCGEADHSILIAKRDRYGFPVESRLCRRCGILRTSPRFAPESLVRFYENDYRQIYDPAYGEDSDAPATLFRAEVSQGEEILHFIRPSIEKNPHLTVFDIGCGAGGVLVPFIKDGWAGYGCDIGGEYLKYGREKGLTLEKGQVRELKEKYGRADLIILSHVFEHIESPLEFLEEVSDVLQENGFLFIESPGIFNIHRVYGDIMAFLQNVHLYNYTLKTLSDVVSGEGFELVRGDDYVHAFFRKSGRKDRGTKKYILKRYYYINILIYLALIAVAFRVVHARGVYGIFKKIAP